MNKILMTLALVAMSVGQANATNDHILVQSTTSTQNSGLYDYLLPLFTQETGVDVRVVAVGTGQAIRNAMNGDADVLLVHAKTSEERFVADGFGVERFDLMYNDFVIIGPKNDPVGLNSAGDLATALTILSSGDAIFVSRGDDSGTHKKERALWESIGHIAEPSNWYRETGSGMGATIRAAIEMQGYTITDRATWIAYEGKNDAMILFEGDTDMFNQYGIIAVNPSLHPHVNTDGATLFINWMLGEHGQALIGAYTRDNQQLFFPNAN